MKPKLANHLVCPNCGKTLPIRRSGRKPLNIPFKNISEALQANRSVDLTASALDCSIGYIYQELRKKGLKPGDVLSKT